MKANKILVLSIAPQSDPTLMMETNAPHVKQVVLNVPLPLIAKIVNNCSIKLEKIASVKKVPMLIMAPVLRVLKVCMEILKQRLVKFVKDYAPLVYLKLIVLLVVNHGSLLKMVSVYVEMEKLKLMINA